MLRSDYSLPGAETVMKTWACVVVFSVASTLAMAAPPQGGAGAKPAAGVAKPSIDKAAIEKHLRRVELWPNQVQVRIGDPTPFIAGLDKMNVHLTAGAASKDILYFISADRKTLVRGESFRLDQDPFQEQLDQLKFEHQPAFGPEQALASLVVFSDFQCPLCAQEAKELRARIPAEFGNDVRVTFADYPLDTIHPWARAAAIAGRCVYRQSGPTFWDFHDWVFERQSEITADNLKSKVAEWAKTKKLDGAQLSQCMDTRATEVEVDRTVALGKRLGVDSTPTNFLNGRRMVGHIPWANLSQIIKLELDLKKRK
jgi:protein-disulfide isomerase